MNLCAPVCKGVRTACDTDALALRERHQGPESCPALRM